MTELRRVPLADILSVTTGRLLSHHHMHGIYDLLGYMTGQGLLTHQLCAAANECKPALIEQHPFLKDLTPPADGDVPTLMAWLAEAERTHGDEFAVQPLADWEHRDPVEDACDMVGAENVFVVPAED